MRNLYELEVLSLYSLCIVSLRNGIIHSKNDGSVRVYRQLRTIL